MTKDAVWASPSGPWSFTLAMIHCAEDSQAAKRVYLARAMLAMPEDHAPDIAQIDVGEVHEQFRLLQERVVDGLRAGRLVATGYRPGSLVEETIPGNWWARNNVAVDPVAGTASANGTTMSGLLISKVVERQTEINDKLRVVVETIFQKNQRAPKEDSYKNEFIKGFPCTNPEYRAARRALPSHLKRTRGDSSVGKSNE